MKFKFSKIIFSENILLFALAILIIVFSVILSKIMFFPKTGNNIKVIKKTAAVKNNSLKEFTVIEVEKHNTPNNCFIIVNKNVYNATSIMPIIKNMKVPNLKIPENPCGKDNTEMFNSILKQYPNYSGEIKNYLKNYLIGKLN